jgi:hypothetical protein
MRYRLIPLLGLLPLILACLPTTSAATPPDPTPSASSSPPPPTQSSLNLRTLEAYHTTFDMHFEGTYRWGYRLESCTDGSAMAYYLHIEGVSTPQNLGDIRVVVEGDVARMRGPATDDACVQFPSDFNLGRSFLSPDDLIPPQDLSALRALGVEAVARREATHYTLRQPELAGWRDVEIDVWRDNETGVTLRYNLQLAGSDPLFDAGDGLLSGQFAVDDIGPQTIEPIAGCEIDLPLPSDAARLVRMPGLIAFESTATSDATVAFYQAALAQAGWESIAEPEAGIDAVVLSYRRDGQTLDVNIEVREAGVYVELLLGE